jgi:hypothetical protein
MGKKLTAVEAYERLAGAFSAAHLGLPANATLPLVRAPQRVARSAATKVLPPDGEYVLAAAEEIAKESDFGGRRPSIAPGPRRGACAWDVFQFAQASRRKLAQAIELSELLPGSFDLGVEVDGDALILNTTPV